jgi:hypothetical protein
MPGTHCAAVLRAANSIKLPLKYKCHYFQAPVGLERSREFVAGFQPVLQVLDSENRLSQPSI